MARDGQSSRRAMWNRNTGNPSKPGLHSSLGLSLLVVLQASNVLYEDIERSQVASTPCVLEL